MMAFDFRSPDYSAVSAARIERLAWLRGNPGMLEPLRQHYREHPAAFIADWGVTSDPRNKLIEWIVARMRSREPGLIEKSRDCGASWLAVCLAATLCLFEPGVVIGFGSSKEDKIDRSGDPDSLFWKARFFLSHLPPEFRCGWDESRHSAHLRLTFPTGSAIVGEAGDNIGRGGRSSLYFIDEAAHLERPQLIEASLASNTDSRIDISTPAGRANAFAAKRWSGRVPVFTFRWTDDPRKDARWYQRQCELLDPVTRAQEIDLSYDASVEGILIPAEWVHAAVDAHRKLGIEPSGTRRAALDVADEGKDKNALAGRHGVLIEYLESWSGEGSNIYKTTVRALGICDRRGYGALDFDSDGLGAGVRGDALDVNTKRREAGKPEIEAEPFRGSGGVFDPDGSLVEGRLNRDYFANLKAQAWWALRLRFQQTYRAVIEGLPFDPDEIISIDAGIAELNALTAELSQPTYSINTVGKIIIDKCPEGAKSPNLADACMILYASALHGGRFVSIASLLPQPGANGARAPIETPKHIDCIFACVAGGVGSEPDAIAIVYFGQSIYMTENPPLLVLDWDIEQTQEAALATWLPATLERLAKLQRGFRYCPRNGGLQIEPAGIGQTLLEQGLAEGLEVQLIENEKITSLDLAQRAIAASAHLNSGQVQLTRLAYEKRSRHKGMLRNHFLSQVIGFGVGEQSQQSGALLVALSNGVLQALSGAPLRDEAAPDSEERAADDASAAVRKSAIEQYQQDLADWEAKRDAAIAAGRARHGVAWQPRSLIALGIGPPPVNPCAGVKIT